MGRRHLSVFTENTSCSLAPSAVIVSSEINGTVFVGEHSLVFDCTLGDGVHIGHGCVIVGIHEKGNVSESSCCQPIEQASFVLPDGHCLWEVPLRGTESRVALCCGIGDNPKSALTNGGTFCGKLLKEFICEKGFQEEDLWPHQSNEWKDLWHAKLFPIMLPGHGISFAMWLMGVFKEDSDVFMSNWQSSERISLAELHGRIDFKRLCYEHSSHHSKLAKGLAKASLESGFLERNLYRLCAQIASEDDPSNHCKELLALCPDLTNVGILQVPLSRAYQAQVDLCRACGEDVAADAFENHVWHSVAAETSFAVRKRDSFESASQNPLLENFIQPYIDFHVRKSRVELPVRIDFVGGWSDTPPWSLEQTGNVLNMAVLLEDCVPIGAEVIVTSAAGISIVDDAGNSLTIKDPAEITTPFQVDDSFRLVKSALLVTGLANSSARWIGGLEIKTWANVPRGSGLGTSSILAAAVVKGLLQIMGGDLSNENVASLVLILEQLMGTGGGWQDQIGGLYPGIKCTTSFPGDSLKLKVEPVRVSSQLKRELEERMLVVFTGQVRMAHQVLQNVVRRYLQRDAILISTIKRLAQLALLGQKTLADGNLENLGRIMSEAWQLHQELDPHCSNTFVDTLFLQVADLASGYKLVGAGGGGFAMLMAKNREAGLNMKEVLKGLGPPVKVYNWSLYMSSNIDHP